MDIHLVCTALGFAPNSVANFQTRPAQLRIFLAPSLGHQSDCFPQASVESTSSQHNARLQSQSAGPCDGLPPAYRITSYVGPKGSVPPAGIISREYPSPSPPMIAVSLRRVSSLQIVILCNCARRPGNVQLPPAPRLRGAHQNIESAKRCLAIVLSTVLESQSARGSLFES